MPCRICRGAASQGPEQITATWGEGGEGKTGPGEHGEHSYVLCYLSYQLSHCCCRVAWRVSCEPVSPVPPLFPSTRVPTRGLIVSGIAFWSHRSEEGREGWEGRLFFVYIMTSSACSLHVDSIIIFTFRQQTSCICTLSAHCTVQCTMNRFIHNYIIHCL